MRNPKELKCFLIVFDVHTKSSSRIFAVPLPGWNKPGLDIYFPDRHGLFKQTDGVTINTDLSHFSDFDWVSEKDAAFTAMDIRFNYE